MHRVGYILSDGFQVMAIGTQAVFEIANLVAGETFYALENYAVGGGEVRSSLGMTLQTRRLTARSSRGPRFKRLANSWISSTPCPKRRSSMRRTPGARSWWGSWSRWWSTPAASPR